MLGHAHTLSTEECGVCAKRTLNILTVTTDTDAQKATLFFTCLTCHEWDIREVALDFYVINIRHRLHSLTRVDDTNWWIQPKKP